MITQIKWVAVIQDRHWVAAKLIHMKNKINVLRLAEFDENLEISSELLIDGQGTTSDESEEVQDSYVDALSQWLTENKIPVNKLQIALSCPGIITRMIKLPIIPRKDLNKLLTEQVDQYFTLDISDYLVDYRVINHIEEDGEKRQNILLAAMPRSYWDLHWTIWEKLGLKPRSVDLSADSLARFYGRLLNVKKAKVKNEHSHSQEIQDIAIVDLGPERAEFVVLEKGEFFLYSDLVLSQNLKELAEKLTFNAQQEAAATIDLPEMESFISETLSSIDNNPEKLQIELENALFPVIRNLQEFFDFFSARNFGKPIDCVYITGECADIPHLEEIIMDSLGVKVAIGFPKEWRPSFGKKAEMYENNWMKYGSLYGLALRED